MQLANTGVRLKQLSTLKMRVELIAWRVQEVGMSPRIRETISPDVVNVFERLLFEQEAPDEGRLYAYEDVVRQVEEDLARDAAFWRSGNETLH